MESGNPINYNAFNGTNYYQPLYNAVIQNVSCNAQIDTLQCLRTVPYQQLNAVFNNTPYDRAFQPVIDGDFIQRYGSAQLATGDFVKVPIISGANTDEGSAFGPRGINDTQQFLSYLESELFPFQSCSGKDIALTDTHDIRYYRCNRHLPPSFPCPTTPICVFLQLYLQPVPNPRLLHRVLYTPDPRLPLPPHIRLRRRRRIHCSPPRYMPILGCARSFGLLLSV